MTPEDIRAAAKDVDIAYEALRDLDFVPEDAVRLVPTVLIHADKRSTL